MKKRVELSYWCALVSALGLAVIVAALCWSTNVISASIGTAALVILCGAALFYMPLTVSARERCLCVRTPLRVKRIPYDEIASIELCAPTMAELRLCGSGGWFGYWGWFREPSIGRYFAYYGKASQCFLVCRKDGRKYMLSCMEPAEMVLFVQEQLH